MHLPAAFFIFEKASSYCSSFPASSDSVMSDPAFCPGTSPSADDACKNNFWFHQFLSDVITL